MDRVTLKLKYDGVIRRVSLKKSPVSMEEVRGVVASMYNLSSYELSYTDEEGDRILVDCDSELLEALEVSRQSGSVSLIRLDLTEIKKPEPKEEIAPEIPCEKEEKEKEEKEEKKSDVPLCYVCKIQAVQLTCHTCDFLLCDTCHFENILFRSHHNPSHIFHTYRKKVDGANVEVRVEIVEEVKHEGLVEEKVEEEAKEEVKEEANEEEQAEEAKDEPLLGFPNPVGSLLKLLLGDPEKKEEAQEEVQEEVKEEVKEVKEEVEEEVKEEVQEEEKIPEARAAALESLLPMGFDPERVNTVLDFVQNNVEAALEILVGDAQ